MTTLVHSFSDLLYSTGNKTSHKILDEYEFLQDFVTDFRVICHWAFEKSIN